MAIFDLGSFNPVFTDNNGGGTISVGGLPANLGKLVVYNDSAVTIQLICGGRTKRILAGMVDGFDLMNLGVPVDTVRWKQDIILSNSGQAPISVVLIDGYTPDEPVQMRLPMAIPRLANVGNTVPVTGESSVLINDGNPPGTQVIEMTPADQPGVSAMQWFNDGSLIVQLLNAGSQMTAIQLIRGSATQDAQIILGDPSQTGVLVMHGTADFATQAGQAQTAVQAQVANTIQMYDGGVSTINSVTSYEGTVDPSTYLVPSYGDLWYEG